MSLGLGALYNTRVCLSWKELFMCRNQTRQDEHRILITFHPDFQPITKMEYLNLLKQILKKKKKGKIHCSNIWFLQCILGAENKNKNFSMYSYKLLYISVEIMDALMYLMHHNLLKISWFNIYSIATSSNHPSRVI